MPRGLPNNRNYTQHTAILGVGPPPSPAFTSARVAATDRLDLVSLGPARKKRERGAEESEEAA